jgi:hypothetical protein
MIRDEILKKPAGDGIDALIEVYILGDDGTNATDKHYSTDNNDVQIVIERLRSLGYEVQIKIGDWCEVVICHKSWITDNLYQAVSLPSAAAYTVPLAVCRAALLLTIKATN